jgi:hypothetical protein
MDEKEAIKKAIDDFFATASEEELLELQTLLEKKKSGNKILGKIDVNSIANKFSTEIKERMGLTTEQINRTARSAVRQMMYQYDPNIPEEQINVLLDQWVPDRNSKKFKVSPDIMRTMISQFVAYGRGELTDDHLKSFPEGWAKKYWSNFPVSIQKIVDAYIKDRINRNDFWEAVEEILK